MNGNNFNFSYQNKDNMEMINDLGSTLEQVAGTVPDGVLIFFPSYRIMEATRNEWDKTGLL